MTKKQQKEQQEIAAIKAELRLMATGARGNAGIEPEDGCDLFSVFDIAQFCRWLSAIESYWNVMNRDEGKWLFRPYNLDEFATYEKAADYLHRQGVRAGGGWKA